MFLVNRKVTYRLYPSAQQEIVLSDTLRLHQRLYNAALEQRTVVYRTRKISLSYVDQAKELTKLRAEFPEYRALNAQSEQVTLTRLDLAFQNFFRRVKSGINKAGFPRFKSLDRYSGWGYKTHGDGWKFEFGKHLKHGKLRLSGVGMVKIRRQNSPKSFQSTKRISSPNDQSPGSRIGLDCHRTA